jgi:hypothetical protein
MREGAGLHQVRQSFEAVLVARGQVKGGSVGSERECQTHAHQVFVRSRPSERGRWQPRSMRKGQGRARYRSEIVLGGFWRGVLDRGASFENGACRRRARAAERGTVVVLAMEAERSVSGVIMGAGTVLGRGCTPAK